MEMIWHFYLGCCCFSFFFFDSTKSQLDPLGRARWEVCFVNGDHTGRSDATGTPGVQRQNGCKTYAYAEKPEVVFFVHDFWERLGNLSIVSLRNGVRLLSREKNKINTRTYVIATDVDNPINKKQII